MTSTTTPRRTTCTLAVALTTALLATAACTRTEGATPAPSPATSGTTSESTTAPSVTPSPTTTTPTTTTAPVPNNGIRTRAPSEVSAALLDTSSFIAGIHVVPTPTGVTATSSNPKCAAFVAGAGGKSGAPGVTGYAIIAFQDDIDPFPFLIEEITTVGSSGRVADVLAALDGATPGCSKVTMKVPGAGSGSMNVSRVTPPGHGDHPTAVRVVGASGPLRGLYVTLVATGVDDAVVQLTFVQALESDIEGMTAGAVERVRKAFTYAKPS